MFKSFAILIVLALTLLARSSLADEPAEAAAFPDLRTGDALPPFSLIDDRGRDWKLAEHVGGNFQVFYFYPGDFTPGCTTQSQKFHYRLKEFAGLGVEVIGISGDKSATHKLFKEAYGLEHTLLADTDGRVAKLLGVPVGPGGKARLMGADRRAVLGKDGKSVFVERPVTLERWTFIVDREGKIVSKRIGVNPTEDATEVLEILKTLPARELAFAAIKSHGAKVEFAANLPGNPVDSITFISCHMKPEDLVHLESLSEIRHLALNGAAITSDDLVYLTGLKNLRTLDLGDTRIDDAGLKHLCALSRLRTLNLEGTSLTHRGLVHLLGLTNLESLNLSFTREELSDEAVTHLRTLKKLKSLDLSFSALSDEGLKALQELTHLESLTLENTNVTAEGIKAFKVALPKVTIVQ